MILTCPNCATRFFADEHAIGPVGRNVECGACGKVWSAPPLPAIQPAWESSAATDASNPPADRASGQAETEAAVPLFVDRGAPKKVKSNLGPRPWALGLVILVIVFGVALLIFQGAIERMFPGAAALYTSLGFKTSGSGGV